MTETPELKKGWILAALMLTMALAAMDSTIISTVIPQIVEDLGGFKKFTWVFSIYLLAQTVTIPIYGKLSDIFGRKKILIFGIIVFLIGSALCAISWDITSLIMFRGLQGVGAGSIMASVNTIAGDIYSVEERAKIQGYLSSIWGISAIIGPAIGGTLAEFANWRWIFIINIPVGILSLGFLITFFKEKVNPGKPIIDYKGALLILSSLTLILVYLLESGQSWAWISWQGLILPIVIMGLIYITYITEKNSKNAIMPLWIWKNKTLAFTNLAMVGMGMVMMGPETFLPTFAQSSLGLGIIMSGFIVSCISLGWPVASSLSGKFYMRIGFRNTSIIGAALILIACIWFVMIPYPQSITMLIANQVLIGGGFGLLSTPALIGPQSMVAWEQRGVVTSTNIFSRNLGQSLGATAFGAIFNSSLVAQMQKAPDNLPASIENIIGTLHDSNIHESAKSFLRSSINISMTHVYYGLIGFAIIILIFTILTPHRDPRDTTLIKVDM